MHYVVAYDIRSDRRRRKVFETLKNYGLPVQLSVVECDLDATRLESMKHQVLALINPRTDRVRIYRLCENCFFCAEGFGTGQFPPKNL